MDVDYITAEIANHSANIACLNTIETVLIWLMIIAIGAILIGIIFAAGADSDLGVNVGVFGILALITLLLIYAGVWCIDWWMTSQYDALLAAYEGMI